MTDTEAQLMGYLHEVATAQEGLSCLYVCWYCQHKMRTDYKNMSKSASSKSNLDQDCRLSSWIAF